MQLGALIEAVRPLDLYPEQPLYMQKCRQNARDRLPVKRHEALRCRHLMPNRRLGLAQNESLPRRELEGTGARDSLGLRLIDRLFHSVYFNLSHRGQVCQAFFNRPLIGPRTPVELGLRQAFGQALRLTCNPFKLLTIFF
jgi:hypothetical protein